MNNSIWDYDLDRLLDEKVYKDVLKFHQSSNMINQNNYLLTINSDLLRWLKENEGEQTLPNIYKREIFLQSERNHKIEYKGSKRNYSKKKY